MKNWVKTGLAVVVVLPILAAVTAPLFVHANDFRPMIEKQLSAALSRKVTMGNLTLSLARGSLVADDLAIAEDPKFGQAPFFTARRLHIGVQLRPLIFHRELVVRNFEIDAPQIHLIRAEDGSWNYSTVGHGGSRSGNAAQRAELPDMAVGHILIEDGTATFETLPAQMKPQVYDHLKVELNNFSLAHAFPFAVSASLPEDGRFEVSGTAGPIDPQDATSTVFDARLKIDHLDPVAAGYVDPAAGIHMLAGLDAHTVSDGTTVTSEGKIHAEHLILLRNGRAAPYPLNVSYKVQHSLQDNKGEVSDLALQTGAVAIHINGTYKIAANEPAFDLKLQADSVPIDSLQAVLPAVGVKLPNNATLKGGTLTAHFAIKGSAKDNVITGSYDIRNTELVGYDIGSKIAGIAALGGIKTGDSTPIVESRSDVRIDKSGSTSTNIYSNLPVMGESTGSGTVSAAGQLDFHLITKITNAKGLIRWESTC
jgi:AsmA protein